MTKTPSITIAVLVDDDNQENVNSFLEGAMLYVDNHQQIRLLEIPFSSGQPPVSIHWDKIDGILGWLGQGNPWILDIPKPKVNCSGSFSPEAMPIVAYDGKKIIELLIEQARRLQVRTVFFLREKSKGVNRVYASCDATINQELKPFHIVYRAFEFPELLDLRSQSQRLLFPNPDQEPEMVAVLKELPKPVLVMTYSVLLAQFVCRLASALGLAIPADIAVITIGDTRQSRMADPPLSVFPLQFKQLGFEAMNVLHAMIESPAIPAPRQTILAPPPPILRASTDRPAHLPQLSQAMELIRLYASNGLTVNELADHMDMHRSHLARLFSVHYGKSPMEAIHEERIKKIQDWLDNTEMCCTRIAELSGFRDAESFFRFFKKQTGQTPTEYRAKSGSEK
jgi:AraC-like DNA-binding protein